jgi:beta-glucuronidase
MLYPIQNDVRNKLDLSGIWDFRTDPSEVGEQEGWYNGLSESIPLAVPGSWNEQYADLLNYLGLSWYVKRTYVPQSWRGQRIFLRVGSANYAAAVYVNGVRVGEHAGGHLPFAFEISEQIRWGEENVIAISVENHLTGTRMPSGNIPGALGAFGGYPSATFDFFPFAGIHRPVVLYSTPQTSIEDITVITGIDGIDGATGTVSVRVKLNTPGPQKGSIEVRSGEQSYTAPLLLAGDQGEATLRIADARLWSDLDPYLYDLTVRAGGDVYSLKIGIRTIEVKGTQMLLNGRAVQLNGFGRHEDYIGSGKGLNLPAMVKDYQLLRWVGANSYRTSHYPYSEEEMQLADRAGFLIIDETPSVSIQFDTAENMAARLPQCLNYIDEMIARDKNHPSVIMWSVANEPMPRNVMARLGGAVIDDPLEEAAREFLHKLVARARELDSTRLVTLVSVMPGPDSWLETCDVICKNLYWGWYVLGGELERSLASLARQLDETFRYHNKPVMLTEFGADTVAGLHANPPVMWSEEYQADLIAGYLRVAAERPYMCGMQIWNFADFAAVQGAGRVGGMNLKGVFTRARQPKLAAHTLRAWWVTKAAAQPTPAPNGAATHEPVG